MLRSTILLTTRDLRQIVEKVGIHELMDEMIRRLERSLVDYDPQEFSTPARAGFTYREPETGLLEWMPTRESDGKATVNMVGYHPRNPQRVGVPTILSTVTCYDTKTGHLRGLADATLLTAIRTGAASAVATRVLANPRRGTLGLVGAGAQALTQLHAISRVLDVERVMLFDVDADVTATFVARAQVLGLQNVRFDASDPKAIMREADIVCTCTSNEIGAGPVVEDDETCDWIHVNAVGSDFPGKVELPVSLLRRSLVCPDFREQAEREGECQQLLPDEIGPGFVELVKGAKEFASHRNRPTVFDSTGWSLEDHLAIDMLLQYAEDLGLGTRVEIECIPTDPYNPYALPDESKILEIAPPTSDSVRAERRTGHS